MCKGEFAFGVLCAESYPAASCSSTLHVSSVLYFKTVLARRRLLRGMLGVSLDYRSYRAIGMLRT